MTDLPKTNIKTSKKQDSKKVSSSPHTQPSRKQPRKGDNPTRVPLASEQSSKLGNSNSWICKNSACRAVLSIDDTFCRRCSCCICHLFDDNKDPSLWLVCSTDAGQDDSCGLSCHIECAFRRKKVGVVDLGQLMQLDGSYCCASCGKVSGILECWKKQLVAAKDARRVDVLCHRIYLSYRLFDGTSRFAELQEFVKDVKTKLEEEVGPMNGVSAKMQRGIVSRLPVANEVQKLCSLAIKKADEWLATNSDVNPNCKEGSLPAACRFFFEEITSSSLVILLLEPSAASSNDVIKGYKLWYCKSREDAYPKEPMMVFPKTQRRILISNLQPCTEYNFRIVSYNDTGDIGHSEAKHFTESVEIFRKNPNSMDVTNPKKQTILREGSSSSAERDDNSSGFKVRDLSKIFHIASAQQQGCFEGFCSAKEKCCGNNESFKPEAPDDNHQLPSVSRGIDLNVVSVPDLNEELTPLFDSCRGEDNRCAVVQAVETDDDVVSRDVNKKALARSHGSGDSQTWANVQDLSRKRAAHPNEEQLDSDSTLINGSPLRICNGTAGGGLDENFEYCVKIIRWLECEGHINQDFRLKLLTWFSLRSTEQERRVVNTFIQTLLDDPSSLAAQLVDSFSDIVSSKRPRNGFCSKLWH